MAINNRWLQAMGANAVRRQTDYFPDYFFFAGSDNTYRGDETQIGSLFLARAISWGVTGIDSKFSVTLRTTDCLGSDIRAYGFSPHELGSDDPLVIEPSQIGSKNNTFSVEIEGEVFFRRPLL